MLTLLFVLFGAMAIGCAVGVVAQRNPLYSAISLIGVFVSLACLYMTLQAPFIAAVQVIVYAGAIMVLVVFVIMLLNAEEEAHKPVRLRFLVPVGVLLAAVLIGETAFMLKLGSDQARAAVPASPPSTGVGLTASIGAGLFTEYLLPFEVTSVLILMALVGAITLARQTRTPLAAAPGNVTAEPALMTAGGVALKPGDTAATGRAFARRQIETGEASAPSPSSGASDASDDFTGADRDGG